MKNSAKHSIIAVLALTSSVHAHQPLEPGGLVGSLVAQTPLYHQTHTPVSFEKHPDGSKTNVLSISGPEHFERYVIEPSMIKPVVVMMQSDLDSDNKSMREVFWHVAESLGDKVIFVSMKIFAQNEGVLENYDILVELMKRYNITKLELPFFLFFKDGDLYAPTHEPSVVLQGVYTKENLESFIANKFFAPHPRVLGNGLLDVTPTPTLIPRGFNSHAIHEKNREKQPWYKRFIQLFKRKK